MTGVRQLGTGGQQVGFDELGEFLGCAGCLRAVARVPVVGLGRREGEGACPVEPAHFTNAAEEVRQFRQRSLLDRASVGR